MFKKILSSWVSNRPITVKSEPGSNHAATTPGTPAPSPDKKPGRRPSPKKIVLSEHGSRPPVKAKDRFATWNPASPQLSTQPVQVKQVLLAAFAPGTQESYGTALAQWHKHCDDEKVAEEDRFPAPPAQVEAWIAKHAGEKSGGYLGDWLSGLKAWHALHGLPWTADEARLTLIRRGAASLQPPPREAREPMTIDWLNAAAHHVNKMDPAETSAIAAASAGFWGLMRLGELVVSKNGFAPRRDITRANVTTETLFGGIHTATLALPSTKTQPQGEYVVLRQQNAPCDPLQLLANHFEQAPTLTPTTTPLFAYRGRGGTLEHLTRNKFLSVMEDIARRAGLPTLQGHSMRIGGCTYLLTNGMPPDRVMLHGRWNSDAFKRYIRQHASVMAPFLAINNVASARLRQMVPEAWPPSAEGDQGGQAPQQSPTPSAAPRARARSTPKRAAASRANSKRGR